MNKSSSEIDDQIKELIKQRDIALAAEQKLKTLSLSQRVAIIIHDNMCSHNHTDGCGWHYEIKNGIHDFSGSAHKHWEVRGLRAMTRVVNAITRSGVNVTPSDDFICDIVEAVVRRS